MKTDARRDGSCTGTGFSKMTFTMLKMAVLAPMPSASERAAMTVKAGLREQAKAVTQVLQHNGTRDSGLGARDSGGWWHSDAPGGKSSRLVASGDHRLRRAPNPESR